MVGLEEGGNGESFLVIWMVGSDGGLVVVVLVSLYDEKGVMTAEVGH